MCHSQLEQHKDFPVRNRTPLQLWQYSGTIMLNTDSWLLITLKRSHFHLIMLDQMCVCSLMTSLVLALLQCLLMCQSELPTCQPWAEANGGSDKLAFAQADCHPWWTGLSVRALYAANQSLYIYVLAGGVRALRKSVDRWKSIKCINSGICLPPELPTLFSLGARKS